MRESVYLPFLLLVTFSSASPSYSQSAPEIETIVSEGRRIYRSELASWRGTDIFLSRFRDRRDKIGGYFSYADQDFTRCVFYSNDSNPSVIGTISFDSSFNVLSAKVDGEPRKFTDVETILYVIRKLALEKINADSLFKWYEGSSLNLVPLLSGEEKRVYVLTASQQSGKMFFGNDYLITFSNDNVITSMKCLHSNVLPVEFQTPTLGGQRAVAGIHSHEGETGEYITSTDIATIMLYKNLIGWEQYYVLSDRQVSIWDCETDKLLTMTREEWENGHNTGRRKKRKIR